MAATILEQVKLRLKQYHVEDGAVIYDRPEEDPYIEQLISQVTREVKARRSYPASWIDEKIEKDMEKYESVIVDATVYDYQLSGADYATSYSESGVSKTCVDRGTLFYTVFPLVHVL